MGGVLMRALAIAVGSVCAIASWADARPREVPPRVAPCTAILVEPAPLPSGRAARGPFSARQLLDLTFRVVFAPSVAFSSAAQMEVRLITPKGHLYRTETVPIAAQGSLEAQRPLQGYRFPVKVRHATWEGQGPSRRRIVEAPALLVAGTDITENAVYGVWRVEAWPRGAQRSCSARFTIVP
jgi:hypothetical protein